LQYPVVFCPFCWEGSRLAGDKKKNQRYLFHDPHEHGQLKMDIGSAAVTTNRLYAIREELAENLRLLYVALTRAAQCCYLAWGPFSGSGTSALAYLLHGGARDDHGPESAGPVDYLEKLSDTEMGRDLARLAGRSAGNIVLDFVATAPSSVLPEGAGEEELLACRRFTGSPRINWRISSFSGLSRKLKVPFEPGKAVEEILDPGGGESAFSSIMDFPRGAGPGTFLHGILEDLDFSANDRVGRASFLRDRLDAGGYDPFWEPALSGMLDNLFRTPLDPDQPELILANIENGARLNELEFYFPLADFNPSGLDEYLGDWPVAGWPADKIRGFMKGYIDLVFCQAGKFYIVDWKSNFLGTNLSEYEPDNLRKVMAREHYYFQYLIYAVALHRYLQIRLPGYRYEENFGGIFYVFLRGLGTGAGSDAGIYRDKPAGSLIRGLSDLFGGGTTTGRR
jgi:exodeoxyribonuclease V beta subunit